MKSIVLAIDIDDDFGKKAKVKGPVIGEKKVIEAATKLALADPEDADANAAFKAVKVYRDMKKKGRDVEVAILTGHKDLGIVSSQRIAQQLESLLSSVNANSVILVTDGVADEVILPLIETRLSLEAVDMVYVKQAKELEKTYFVLLEKLRDPTYAKTIFGIPAILLILLSLMYIFAIPWQFLGFLVGTYLLVKGFGFEDKIYEFVASSIEVHENIRFLLGLVLMLFFLTAVGISYISYVDAINSGLSQIMAYMNSIDVFINFLGLFLVLLMLFRIMYHYFSHNIFRMLSSVSSLISVLATFLLLKIVFSWVLTTKLGPLYFYFGDVVQYTIGIVVVSYIFYRYIDGLKKNLLNTTDMG
ncbi:MAG: DUF373 family protein, partial [Bdellovibrio sp.]